MEKSPWGGFFPNLLGVILGIVLTFGVNSLWQRLDEKKKTKEMLILVRNELETNREWFKYQEENMKRDHYVFKKILEAKGNWSTIPADTLKRYRQIVAGWSFTQLSSSSWQIFQGSEMIQKMPNKELVIRLTSCYYWIEKIEGLIVKEYWERKKRTNAFEADPSKYFDAVMANKESVSFYERMGLNSDLDWWYMFTNIKAIIDYTLLLMDKNDDYRYNMEHEDKAFESFIQFRIDSLLQSRGIVSDTAAVKQK